MASTEKEKSKPGETTSKLYNKRRLTQLNLLQCEITMHQEHKNAIIQNKLK